MAKITRRGFLQGGVAAGVAASTVRPGEARADDTAPPPEPGQVDITTTINGQKTTLRVEGDETTAQILRDQLDLTGTKIACGHGACGACVCKVDGRTVSTCLLPVTALQGAQLETVEHLGATELHPVQRAFMAEDALQCGFCTPGFIVEAAAFHDQWREEHGTKAPARDDIAAALAGHLCRCGAYQAIYRAVEAACTGKHDAEDPIPARPDAREKVTGAARYTVDKKLDGMLYAAILRSPMASAIVRKVDVGAALQMGGVRAALILTDVGKKVFFAGQGIVAVAADSRKRAQQALEAIVVDYVEKPPVTSMDAAMAEGAPVVFPPGDRKEAHFANEFAIPMGHWSDNVRGPIRASFGLRAHAARGAIEEVRTGMGGVLVEGVYNCATQIHTTLEPHSALAVWETRDDRQHLILHTSTQATSDLTWDLAQRFRIRREEVHVRSEYVGGGFGAKATMQPEHWIAGELARRSKAPVLVELTRSGEMLTGGQRPGARMHLAMVASEDGWLQGFRTLALNDGGVSTGSSVTALQRVTYQTKNKALHDYDVISHTPPGKPFRGPGGPQAIWSLELAIDEMAERLSTDPLALRQRWDPHPVRQMLYDWLGELPIWRGRHTFADQTGRFRRGLGMAMSPWPYILSPPTQVQLDADETGFTVKCGTQDMGNGPRGVLAISVAQVLGIAPHEVRIDIGNSDHVYGPTSGGSRTTTSVGPSATHAAEQMRDALVDLAEQKGLKEAQPGKGGVDHSGGHMPWAKLLEGQPSLSFVGRRKKDKGGYFTPMTFEHLRLGKGLGNAVALSEVEVDTKLGRVRVLQVWAGIGVGRIYNPVGATSQVEGAVMQGCGYALCEERRIDPRTGRQLTVNLEDYRLLGIGDAPKVHVHFEERGFEHVTGGGIGLAEVAGVPVPASIGNAVAHATGRRFYDLPLRPDRVLGVLA